MTKITLEQYLKNNIMRKDPHGVIDFSIRANYSGPVVSFYIHPAGRDGDTIDFVVSGNQLMQVGIEE